MARFVTPTEALTAEVEGISTQINSALGTGARSFNVPRRTAKQICEGLRAAGWTADAKAADGSAEQTTIAVYSPE